MRKILRLIAALALCPVANFREVVKDLMYRNAAEAALARVDVAERRLEVARRYDLLDDPEVREVCLAHLLERPERAEARLELPRGPR